MARRAREVRRFREELLDELLTGAGPAEVFAAKRPSGSSVSELPGRWIES